MVEKQDFLDNVNSILQDGIVEKQPLSNLDILQDISKDDFLMTLFYLDFENNYPYDDGLDMLLSKSQDFVYRLNMVINDWLISIHNINSIKEIKNALVDMIMDNVDFYSAVSYDNSDKELIKELEDTIPSLKF